MVRATTEAFGWAVRVPELQTQKGWSVKTDQERESGVGVPEEVAKLLGHGQDGGPSRDVTPRPRRSGT